MAKEARAHLNSALDLMEAAVDAGITNAADLTAKLKLGQAVAEFMAPRRAAGILLPPQFEKVLERGEHIITMDLANGLSWDVREFDGRRFKHEPAVAACTELRTGGFSDWRLPVRREHLTLVDDTRFNPAIDKEFFPNCKSDWYRCGNVYAPFSDYRWGVDFYCGDSSNLNDDGVFLVRAVRASQ